MIRVGGYCADWDNKALFSRVYILFIAINNLILRTLQFHTIVYKAIKLKFSYRWVAFGKRPKWSHSEGWPLPDPLSIVPHLWDE